MTYFKLSFLFSAAVACTLVACGSDDSGNDSGDDDSNSSNTGSGGTDSGSGGTDSGSGGTDSGSGGTDSSNGSNVTSGNTTTGGGGSNACNPGVGGGGGSDECTDYGECVQRECASEYEECLGENFASGNPGGGVCGDYTECANDCQSEGECDTTCLLGCFGNISEACQTCLEAANECGSEACADEYEACNGEPPTTTTTTTSASTTGGGDGTCEDLEACCNSLEGDAQEGCLAGLDAAQQGGDQICAVLLASYESAGEC